MQPEHSCCKSDVGSTDYLWICVTMTDLLPFLGGTDYFIKCI